MIYDRSISDREKALDDMLTKSKESAESYLKDTNKVFSDALTYVNANSSQVASNIEKIAKDVGYDISSYIVNSWKDGGDAVGDYASTLSSNVPNITAQLGLIASSWQSICDAADRAAEASAKYAETNVNGTQNIGSNTSNTSNSTTTTTSSGSGTGTGSKSKNVIPYIKANVFKAGHEKSYYGALNQYLYDKLGGKVLGTKSEVELAKMLGVSVKDDLSGKNDRERILAALKKATVNSKFANGGVLGDLVKVSGEDGLFIGKAGESILTKEQTQALLKFTPVIPQVDSIINTLKDVPPVNRTTMMSEPHIEIHNTVEGVATDQIVDKMSAMTQKQVTDAFRKVNNAVYAKGVRRG